MLNFEIKVQREINLIIKKVKKRKKTVVQKKQFIYKSCESNRKTWTCYMHVTYTCYMLHTLKVDT